MADKDIQENKKVNEENNSEVFHDASDNVPEVNQNAPAPPPPPPSLNTLKFNKDLQPSPAPTSAPAPLPPPPLPSFLSPKSEDKSAVSERKLPFSNNDLLNAKHCLKPTERVQPTQSVQLGNVVSQASEARSGPGGKVFQISCGDIIIVAVCGSSNPAAINIM